MPKFFVKPENISGGTAVLAGEKAAHITKSLRMSAGERVILCDGEGTDYRCVIDSVGTEVRLTVEKSFRSSGEPPYRAVVYQALSKGDRFDAVIQKSVEYGAHSIVPVRTERATVRLNAEECCRKSARWQRIAESAAEQCGRGIIPKIGGLLSFTEAVEAAAAANLALFCYENEESAMLREKLQIFVASQESGVVPEIAVIVGPEGGFSDKEAAFAANAAAKNSSFNIVSLGSRILRTESAAPFVLACLCMTLDM